MRFTSPDRGRTPNSSVHPHVRGVYELFHIRHIHAGWSIPTCVGFTVEPFLIRRFVSVHPHVRGVYGWPRTGGPPPSVHPHVRGVYAQRPYSARQQCGPSPRAWGLRWARPRPCSWSPVHPHVRGVYEGGTDEESDAAGPSPRSWGLRSLYVWQDGGAAVHPHVRGVYIGEEDADFYADGPSPRAWGLPTEIRRDPAGVRSIPTCVGFTTQSGLWMPLAAVHPHVRGVYKRSWSSLDYQSGPSPRAWGLQP